MDNRTRILTTLTEYFNDWTYIGLDFDRYPITDALASQPALRVEWEGGRRKAVIWRRGGGYQIDPGVVNGCYCYSSRSIYVASPDSQSILSAIFSEE